MANLDPWCYDDSQPLEEAGKVFAAVYEELLNVHSLISDSEWKEITEPIKPEEHEVLKPFIDRPTFETLYNFSFGDDGDPYEIPEFFGTFPESEASLYKEIKNFNEEASKISQDVAAAGVKAATAFNEFEKLVAEFLAFDADYSEDEETTIQNLQINLSKIDISIFQRGWSSLSHEQFQQTFSATYSDPLFSSQLAISSAFGGEDINAKLTEYINAADIFSQSVSALAENAKTFCNFDFKEYYTSQIIRLAAFEAAEADPGFFEQLSKQLVLKDYEFDAWLSERIKEADKIKAAIEQSIRQEIEEAFADNLIYSEQCLMLTFIKNLLAARKKLSPFPGVPYREDNLNAPISIGYMGEKLQQEPFGFLNRFVTDPSQKSFFDFKDENETIRSEILSQMTPYLRFYKVEPDEKGTDKQIEFTFDAKTDLGSLTQDPDTGEITVLDYVKNRRTHGVGLNSFNFSYEGTDPFSAKKMISAKLSIFAGSFDQLLEIKKGGFRYIDLALKTGKSPNLEDADLTKIQRENLDKLNFRLKVVVGWSVPKSIFSKLSENLQKAIYNSYITLYLTPTIHNFQFDETGAVTFDIEYLAYMEDVFSQTTFNIFSFINNELEARKSIFEYFESVGCNEDSPNAEFKEFLKKDERVVTEINSQAFSKIVQDLIQREKIFYLNLTYEDIDKLLQDPSTDDVVFPVPTVDPEGGEDLARQMLAAAQKASQTTAEGENKIDVNEALLALTAVSVDNNSVAFFYFGDLVETIMKQIELGLERGVSDFDKTLYATEFKKLLSFKVAEKQFNNKKKKFKSNLEQFQKMRTILGPIEVFTPIRDYERVVCSLSELPISLNYFFDFLSDKVLSREIISYPFSKFLKDFINDIIKNFLNSESCTRIDNSQKIKLTSTTISGYNTAQNKRGSWRPGKPSVDDISYYVFGGGFPRDRPPIQLGGTRNTPEADMDISRAINYFMMSAGKSSPSEAYVGNKEYDSQFGIFHYGIGSDKGIVKNIALDRTNTVGLKEVRFEQEGYEGLTQLREVYNVTIDTFLNVQTFPGTYLYVEPRSFAPGVLEDLTRFGIGGYNMIVKTSHKIAPGVADTTLNAVWVASKEGKPSGSPGTGNEKRKPEGDVAVKKCLTGIFRGN